MELFVVEQGTFYLYSFLYKFRHDFFRGKGYIRGYFWGVTANFDNFHGLFLKSITVIFVLW